jgi:hypothetical protein
VIPGNGVHAISLLPGDDIHLAPHTIHAASTDGQHWEREVGHGEADVHVERVRPVEHDPALVALYWWLGSASGVSVYGRTALVPLLHRVA